MPVRVPTCRYPVLADSPNRTVIVHTPTAADTTASRIQAGRR